MSDEQESDGFGPEIDENVENVESDGDGYDITQKIVLHVYNDESKEFTSLTTYHGMVRIYNSNTWPSLIFWCLVVVSCVFLFMVHSGYLLQFYVSRPTFLDTKHIMTHLPFSPTLTFCMNFDNQNLSYDCNDFLKIVNINGQKLENSCEIVIQKSKMNSIICYKINELFAHLFDKIDIVFQPIQDSELFFVLGKESIDFDILHDGIHIPTGFISSFEILMKSTKLLDTDNWGKCNKSASNTKKCQEDCMKTQILEKCSCLPWNWFENTETFKCSENLIKTCVKPTMKNIKCHCPIQCQRVAFDFTRSSMMKAANFNYSEVRLSFYKHMWIYQEQIQRFRTVDVLSFVGGSMGLFLGMSCVTLMEVFMFLFKSIWGITNNQRHKKYLSKLLGERVAGLLSESEETVRGSHEKIVITQTVKENQCDSDSQVLPPITLQFKVRNKKNKLSVQISNAGQETSFEKRYVPSYQRFRANSNRSVLNSVERSEIVARQRASSYKSVGLNDF